MHEEAQRGEAVGEVPGVAVEARRDRRPASAARDCEVPGGMREGPPAGIRRRRANRCCRVRSEPPPRAPTRRSLVRCSPRSACRARWMASGSTSRPIAWAMSVSLGSVKASALKAGSSSSLIARRPSSSAKRGSKAGASPRRIAAVARSEHGERDLLRRLPAVERVGIAADQEQAVLRAEVRLDLHGRGELAEQRTGWRAPARPRTPLPRCP